MCENPRSPATRSPLLLSAGDRSMWSQATRALAHEAARGLWQAFLQLASCGAVLGEPLEEGSVCDPCVREDLVVPTLNLACPAPIVDGDGLLEKALLLGVVAGIAVSAFTVGLSLGRRLCAGGPAPPVRRPLVVRVHHSGRPGVREGVPLAVRYSGYRLWHERPPTGKGERHKFVVVTPEIDMYTEPLSVPPLAGRQC